MNREETDRMNQNVVYVYFFYFRDGSRVQRRGMLMTNGFEGLERVFEIYL